MPCARRRVCSASVCSASARIWWWRPRWAAERERLQVDEESAAVLAGTERDTLAQRLQVGKRQRGQRAEAKPLIFFFFSSVFGVWRSPC